MSTVTWGTAKRWKSGPLTSASKQLTTLATTVSDSSTTFFATSMLDKWIGVAAEAAETTSRSTAAGLLDTVSDITYAATAVGYAATDIASLEKIVADIEACARRDGLTIGHDGSVKDVRTPPASVETQGLAAEYQEMRTELVQALAARVGEVVRQADLVDQTLRLALSDLATGKNPSGPALDTTSAQISGANAAPRSLPPPPPNATPGEIALWLATLSPGARARIQKEHPEWLAPSGLPGCTVSTEETDVTVQGTYGLYVVKGKASSKLVKSLDANGKPVWTVEAAAGLGGGVRGRWGSARPTGDGLGAGVDAQATGRADLGTVYEFATEEDARRFFERLQERPDAVRDGDRYSGRRTSTTRQGTLEGEVEAGYDGGMPEGHVKGSAGGTYGQTVSQSTPGGPIATTEFTQLDASVEAELKNRFPYGPATLDYSVSGAASYSSRIGVTRDANGVPIRVTIERTVEGKVAGGAGPGAEVDGLRGKPLPVDGTVPGELSTGRRHVDTVELDLSNPLNQRAYEQAVNTGVPGGPPASQGDYGWPTDIGPLMQRANEAGPSGGVVHTGTTYRISGMGTHTETDVAVAEVSLDGTRTKASAIDSWYVDDQGNTVRRPQCTVP